jgi:ubiquinone/menaquinone biosynthesis C-methylase UbiE
VSSLSTAKQQVQEFWNRASCGEALYLSGDNEVAYRSQAKIRYELEPYIEAFAGFDDSNGKHVLEIGVGLGADHQRFAEGGAKIVGIDLTERAIDHTRCRLAAFGLKSSLSIGDAEELSFADESFDRVFSWGVLHHTPDTQKAVSEVWRVLRPGGEARVMIYHKWSLVGLMLWVRYALIGMRPWLSLTQVYSRYLESPGTKAYSIRSAEALFSAFSDVRIRTELTHGDLLESGAGQRHAGTLLSIARALWPRAFIRRWLSSAGLFMLIEARK